MSLFALKVLYWCLIAGALVLQVIGFRQLRKSNKALAGAQAIQADSLRLLQALQREQLAALKFGGAAELFNRPPGCLCREVVAGALKIEDYCPAHRGALGRGGQS